MFGSAVLDTAIGLILVFFTISTVCSNIFSLISRTLNTRGRLLNESLQTLLGPDLYQAVMEHPMVKEASLKKARLVGLSVAYEDLPNWIDPDVFSQAMADICTKYANAPGGSTKIVNYFIEKFHETLEAGQEKAEHIQHVRQEIEKWYNTTMSQLTEIFRRHSQTFIAVIAILVTIIFNINTITIVDSLWRGPTLRDAVVDAAATQVAASQAAQAGENGQAEGTEGNNGRSPAEIIDEELASIAIPIGWSEDELATLGLPDNLATTSNARQAPSLIIMLVGWLITVGAAMFGAPFWFDLLKRLTSLREQSKSDHT